MLKANQEVGRLLEARGEGAVSHADFAAFRSSFLEKMARISQGSQIIAVGDLRGMDELAAEVSPMVLGLLKSDNVRLERSAHLVTAGSAFARQYEAIVGATRNPMRRVFYEPAPLISWVGEVLTPAELTRLRAMLA